MLILTIRTDKPEAELGLFADTTQLAYSTWQAHRELAETIHIKLQELLQSQDEQLNGLGGIIVYQGPGSFTGLRIGISVANALAYSLRIPIVGQVDTDWIIKGQEALGKTAGGEIIQPSYGSPPHITHPKK